MGVLWDSWVTGAPAPAPPSEKEAPGGLRAVLKAHCGDEDAAEVPERSRGALCSSCVPPGNSPQGLQPRAAQKRKARQRRQHNSEL